MSTSNQKHGTDDKFYLSNGQMVTDNPKEIISVNVTPNYTTVAKNSTQNFTAQVLRRDGSEDTGGVTWKSTAQRSPLARQLIPPPAHLR
jgi:hypothetical protein